MWFLKKENGAANIISAVLVNIISLFVFYAMVVMMIDSTKTLDTKNSIYAIGDEYIQLMMSEGYLTPEDKADLTEKLEALGVHDIDFTGTTFTQVGYGERITLQMTYKCERITHNLTSIFSIGRESREITGSYLRKATAFY